ncbi:MAG: sigma-70 family RNA polymerase sigma factor [Bacteroidia bacterium]
MKWVDKYGNYLLNFAFLRINKQELAEDLVQDTFLSALKAKDQFRGDASEKTWLTGILKNKIIDHYKKASTRYEMREMDNSRAGADYGYFFSEEHNGHWVEKQGPSEWGESSLESKEFFEIFNQCMAKLPEKWAMAFSMKTIDELSSEEICKEMQLSSSNFWVIIHRAKLQLRACIEKNWIRN